MAQYREIEGGLLRRSRSRAQTLRVCRRQRHWWETPHLTVPAANHSSSFLRKQEPITTDVRGCETYLPLVPNEKPRRMGPGSRLLSLACPGRRPWISDSSFQTANCIPAARCARVVHECSAQRERARGMPGARCTGSLACKIKKHTR